VWWAHYCLMRYNKLISAHVTSELSQLILHVSTGFTSRQLALLAHNPVLLHKSIFVIGLDTKCFIVIPTWILWDVIIWLYLQGVIQAECFVRMSLVFTVQDALTFKCCFIWRVSYLFRSVWFACNLMADLFLGFGRDSMSVTCIAFSIPVTGRCYRK
jgi:hypothetical protein